MLFLPLLVWVTGCAGAGFNGAVFQHDVAEGKVDRAMESLKAFPKDDVSALLDRALLFQVSGDPKASNQAFEAAELRIADLYTRSLSREALSLVTGDRALEYRAAAHEHAYIAYFQSWNYLDLGDRDGALVEARRIGERLDYLSSACPEESGACGHDPFLRYWSGVLFEWGGEINDAYVAYKLADQARRTGGTRPRGEDPPDLGRRLVALAHRLGFDDEARSYAETYGVDPDSGSAAGRGTLMVVWENGLIGRREETGALIPIFKGETEQIRKDQTRWSKSLAERRGVSYEETKLEYLMRIALPTWVESPPRAEGASFTFGEHAVETIPVAPLSAMAQDALNRAMGGIVIRAVARALTKYLATEAVEDEAGEGAGLLANLLGVIFESAETRSWRTLPYEIHLVPIEAPTGTHTGTLRTRAPDGGVVDEIGFDRLEIPSGGIVFARYRSSS